MSTDAHDVRETAGEEHPAVTLGEEEKEFVYHSAWVAGVLHGNRDGWYAKVRLYGAGSHQEAARRLSEELIDPKRMKRCYDASLKSLKDHIKAVRGNLAVVKTRWFAGYSTGYQDTVNRISERGG